MCFCCVYHIHFENFRYILECCHMVGSRPGIMLMCAFSYPSDFTFSLFFSSVITWGSVAGVPTFVFQISFWKILIFGVTVKSWLLIGWTFFVLLLGSLVEVHLGMPLQ